MAAQHTPGPWTIERVKSSDDTFVYARIGPAGRGSIAYSGVYGHKKGNAKLSESEAMANATLIAAAPELLEACQANLKAFRAIYDILENEENCNPDELIEVLLDEEDYWPLSQIRAAIAKAEPS